MSIIADMAEKSELTEAQRLALILEIHGAVVDDPRYLPTDIARGLATLFAEIAAKPREAPHSLSEGFYDDELVEVLIAHFEEDHDVWRYVPRTEAAKQE